MAQRTGEKAKVLLEKSWRKVRRQIDDFTHKLDNKLIVFKDSEYGEKTFARIGNNGLLGATSPTAYKVERRGLVVNRR
ncbi:MAG: hypothetical protein QXH39_00190 [Conexivisphaerales archaeon]